MPNKSAVILILALTGSLPARTYSVPGDEPIARVSIPDRWQTEQREEYLDSSIPANGGHVLVMPVEGPKLGESMLEAMRYIRRNGTVRVDARSEKRETIQAGERSVRTFSWTATEKDRPIVIRCHMIPDLNGKRLLVVFWGPPESERKHKKELGQILESIRVP